MGTAQSSPGGPDLTQGIAADTLGDGGMLLGHVADEAVLRARRGSEVFAVGATCTHYSGPLAEGLMVGDTVRCPWHHARFCLRSGEALGAPAFNRLPRWRVEQSDGTLRVVEKLAAAELPHPTAGTDALDDGIVILGGGAAGFAAAEMLRRENYAGRLTMISADDAAPYDRPNLSKDYLAGTAQEDWIPLRPPEFYAEQAIELRLRTTAEAIDPQGRQVILAGGERLGFGRLLLATGAEPVRLTIPGADAPHVHVLRSFADSQAIIASAQAARRAVVMGASFIGLEVAASLRHRDLEVHVVAPEAQPMERVLGPQFAALVRTLHDEHGVRFHLGDSATAIEGRTVVLKSGVRIDADLVVAGIGVRPRLALAEAAGLKVDRGVLVDEYLETSCPGIFAAGDIVRWPDPISGDRIRVEHWVVATRQGQAAARNMLGRREPFREAPFFWSQHYDVPINYVGHAESHDDIQAEGDIAGRNGLVRFRRNGKALAVVSVYRDRDSLEAEVAMERAAG
jgi:NADPH-dependent 2,4-dienoyl-CoA reductase/sulfur reductase-like enzyme/nitrite reductase/ring-hydroxylating ferredoxin subunit